MFIRNAVNCRCGARVEVVLFMSVMSGGEEVEGWRAGAFLLLCVTTTLPTELSPFASANLEFYNGFRSWCRSPGREELNKSESGRAIEGCTCKRERRLGRCDGTCSLASRTIRVFNILFCKGNS